MTSNLWEPRVLPEGAVIHSKLMQIHSVFCLWPPFLMLYFHVMEDITIIANGPLPHPKPSSSDAQTRVYVGTQEDLARGRTSDLLPAVLIRLLSGGVRICTVNSIGFG